jgi:hypothetical protein
MSSSLPVEPSDRHHPTNIDQDFAWCCYIEAPESANRALRTAATVGASRLRGWQADLGDAAGYGAWLQRDASELAFFLQ